MPEGHVFAIDGENKGERTPLNNLRDSDLDRWRKTGTTRFIASFTNPWDETFSTIQEIDGCKHKEDSEDHRE